MALVDEIKTINDMMQQTYLEPFAGRFITEQDVEVAKAVATTATTGVYNAIYGQQAWIILNMEANAFGCLPKVPWTRSGWRVITARADFLTNAGVGEDGSLMSAVAPTIATLSTKPKTMHALFEVSQITHILASEKLDDTFYSMADARTYALTEHKEDLNRALLGDVTTVAGNNFESLDRVVSTKDEEDSCADVDAGDNDIYGLDRDANTIYDAYVAHNSDTDREFTESLLMTAWRNVMTNGSNLTFFLTGWDTLAKWNLMFSPQVRYNVMGQATVSPGVNGIQAYPGIGTGISCATYLGKPIIVSKNCVQDTVSRVYLLDTSNPEGYYIPRLCFKTLVPTTYYEAGVGVGRPLEIAKLNLRGMYATVGELICPFFKAQGKIRDLK